AEGARVAPPTWSPRRVSNPPPFRLRVGPYPSAWTRPGPSWLLRGAGDSIQCRPAVSGISAWVAREVSTVLRCPSELALTRHVDHPIVIGSSQSSSTGGVERPGGR